MMVPVLTVICFTSNLDANRYPAKLVGLVVLFNAAAVRAYRLTVPTCLMSNETMQDFST